MRVQGRDPASDPVAVHRAVGYLPGELALFPRMTGREHLDWLARGRGTTDLTLRDELVERFDAELDRPVRTLSKGNRQKIGLILAFFHRPDVLVLDEPTSGLDPLLQDEFDHLLRETVADGTNGVPVLARTGRGAAGGRPGGDHQGRPTRAGRHGPGAAQQRTTHGGVPVRPSRRRPTPSPG